MNNFSCKIKSATDDLNYFYLETFHIFLALSMITNISTHHTPNPLSQSVSHNSVWWCGGKLYSLCSSSEASCCSLTGTPADGHSGPQAGPERFKLMEKIHEKTFRCCRDISTTHLQSCSQTNVQFLTTLDTSRASSLCNEISAESSACAACKSINVPNKTNKVVSVGAWRKISQWKFVGVAFKIIWLCNSTREENKLERVGDTKKVTISINYFKRL
jgi:hypothetical protein